MFTFLVLIVMMFNFTVTGDIEYKKNILNYDYKNYEVHFIIGLIDNLTYFDYEWIEFYGYNFSCRNVIILIFSNVDGFKIIRCNNNENWSIVHIYFENIIDADYKGLISNKFIFCVQTHNWDFN